MKTMQARETEKNQQEKMREYYTAFLRRDFNFEGVFFVGIKTTGIFCRPTCAARKAKFENCEFFSSAQEALIASYRPCKRCKPLSHGGVFTDIIEQLINKVEENPAKRWKNKDFEALLTNAVAARRSFKQKFGMTFVQYARARRMGLAFQQIRQGGTVIDSQLELGYESASGFRDAFSKIMGMVPSKATTSETVVLKASWVDTLLGPMLAIADNEKLYLLEFADRRGLEKEIETLRKRHKAAIIPGETSAITTIKKELADYFSGKLKVFQTPLHIVGSTFQKQAWQALQKIPYGETRSYLTQAKVIGNEKAFRAVANANGANQFAIVIPCHRIIQHNGDLGGYGGGKARKEWLILHEKQNLQSD